MSTYILYSAPTAKSRLHIHRLTHTPTINELPKSLHTYSAITLDFGSSKVLDAKFADDSSLLVLLQLDDEAKTCILIFLSYTASASSTGLDPMITYTPLSAQSHTTILLPTGAPIPLSNRHLIALSRETIRTHTKHVFEGRFTPLKLIVNGRKGRRVVVVLGSDKKHYRVLDLDYKGEKGKESEDEGKPRMDEEESSTDSEIDIGVDVEMVGT